MTRLTSFFAATVAAAALALPAAAGDCGSKATTSAAKQSQAQIMPASYSPAPEHHAPAAEAPADIVDTAIGAGSFNTLVAAVSAAGLVDTLKGDGPFTVFAPTDEAFGKLPEGTVASLLEPENIDKLKAVLTLHVVAGDIRAADLVGKITPAVTVNGETVIADGTDGVRVGTAMVTTPDIVTSNGVIHVIDRVLIPTG